MEHEVRHNEKKRMFYIEIDKDVAHLDYAITGDKMDLYHTFTPPHLRGNGLAGKIVEFAFNFAKQNNLKVIPSCPFIPSFLERKPEYIKLVSD